MTRKRRDCSPNARRCAVGCSIWTKRCGRTARSCCSSKQVSVRKAILMSKYNGLMVFVNHILLKPYSNQEFSQEKRCAAPESGPWATLTRILSQPPENDHNVGAQDGCWPTKCSGKKLTQINLESIFIDTNYNVRYVHCSQTNTHDIHHMEQLLRHKDNQVQTVHARYLAEIEKLTRKLQQRDDTLRRVLHAKTNAMPSKQSAPVLAANISAGLHSSYPVSTKGDREQA